VAATETLAWQRSHREPRRIILVAYNTATFKAYQQALSAAGQSVDEESEPSSRVVGMGLSAQAMMAAF